MITTKQLRERRKKAQTIKQKHQGMLDDAFKYAIPYTDGGDNEGERKADQIFDHTAVEAAYKFAGKMQTDLWPAGEQNFELEPGPVFPRDKQEQAKQYTDVVSSRIQSFFEDGEWDLCFHEMALQLAAGTGAILMNSTDDPDELWEPISVNINELLLQLGPNNKVHGIFWNRTMSMRVAKETWPDGTWGADLEKLYRDKADEDTTFHADTVFDRAKKRWRMVIWHDKQKARIHAAESKTNPWLTPRYFRVPGETWGRGVIHLALPSIKVLNTTKRLQLQAAAIALLGIFTVVDDGVFNPDLSPLEPGAFWKVDRNDGPRGATVNRFPDPRLDLSDFIIKDMQLDVKATMLDRDLPPDSASVRSATEILERVRRLATDHLGAYGRLVKEVVIPAVRRTMELAYRKGLIPDEIPIDQLLYRVRVKSPIAQAREAQRVEKIVQWLELIFAFIGQGGPDQVRRVAKLEQALAEIGAALDVPNRLIVTDDERKKMDDEQTALVTAQLAAGLTEQAA